MPPKAKVVKDEKSLHEVAGKIADTDEMKLQLLEAVNKPDPDDLLYPAELNAHLLEQLKVMTGENNQLRKLIFTKDEEIKEATKTIDELHIRIRDIISGSGPTISAKSAGIISQKLTDLCKQNRHLIAEVEGYKTKNAALERKVIQLELITKDTEKVEPCLCKDERFEGVNPDEFKELTTKLAIVNRKLCDTKNKNLELKNEILAATKILQQELGDKFTTIKELQHDIAGWKGRAQQIVCLQAKIAELEDKLNVKNLTDKNEPKKSDQAAVIKDLENKRKKEIDQAMKCYQELKEENQALKKKLEAAKCRVRNVECDATLIRQRMQTFMEKSNHDDLLINEQRNQIKTSELYYQEILRENTTKMNKMQNQINESHKYNENTEAKIDALRKQLNEKSSKIEELRAQLLRYEECSLQSVFFTPMKTATDNEIQKLTELTVKLNDRLTEERRKYDELEANNRKLREKKKRLERRVSTLEADLSKIQELKRGSRGKMSVSGVKDKDKEEHSGSLASSALLMKKRSSLGTIPDKVSENSSSTEPPPEESLDQLNKHELKYRLELTEEKLKIMEDKLKMLEEEKTEDYNHLTSMIQTSKQLFNEALIVLQKEKCICTKDNMC